MSEHTFDDKEMRGYFLPEDSQVLLKQLSGHVRFLARLAQPRMVDETQEWAPEVGMAEWMFCLDQLAEQLDLVLKQVSWLERPSPSKKSSETLQAEADKAQVPDSSYAPTPAGEERFVFGVTMDQIDTLNLLIKGIKAYGDAVFADGMADFADGTLSMLGYTIFDRAVEVDDIVTQINAQHLEEGARLRFSVEETPPAYCLPTPCETKDRRLGWLYQPSSPGWESCLLG